MSLNYIYLFTGVFRMRRQTDDSALIVAYRLLSSAMRSSDEGDWPVHFLMLPFHNLRDLLLRRPLYTAPCGTV